MQSSIISKKQEWLIHLLFWMLTAYFTFVQNPFYFKFVIPDLFYITYLIAFLATFYVHYLAVMKWVFKAFQWKKLLFGMFVSCLLFIGLRWFIEQFITGILFHKVNYINPSFTNYVFDNLYYSSKPILCSSFLWFIIYFIRLLEEKKNTEIKFLKAQINPHFVFNTLNNIYSMVYFQSDQSLTAIAKLGEVMRFTTYYSQKEKINLTDEIDYIKAYIELEQLRHQENAFVDLNIKIDDENVEIPPYTLSPLVENALKHGLASNQNPIKIEFNLQLKRLTFSVINEIGTQKKDKLAGIGLGNLKKRLEIYYPGAHSLTLTNKNNKFEAQLQIDLK
ncbi:sensor histidine kinase [Pedobacter punctiformis]|uniref:Histidine kinase n=1 Tax=Pedobacter punctiformis TaxID=3004097 RepID=A0ABT4L8M9_9SPHI|nr:histidine kinase [Pedobacter sp. HCMS5-2]MCZ4244255.1 histidine kinase [Pedobacter sp. HCMS5-2]